MLFLTHPKSNCSPKTQTERLLSPRLSLSIWVRILLNKRFAKENQGAKNEDERYIQVNKNIVF